MTKQLVIVAMNIAIIKSVRGCNFSLDRGLQYMTFRTLLGENRILQSMSEKGTNTDNACAESFFFAQLRRNWFNAGGFQPFLKVTLAILNYIVSWYNPHRIQSALGDLSPVEFEPGIL